MKNGGWVPIAKGLARALPNDRPYSELEAAFSLQLDFDSGNGVTISGYASLWRWSKNKVRRFLRNMNVEIAYPEDTRAKQNQRGLLKRTDIGLISDRNRTDVGLIRFIDSKYLWDTKDRKRADTGQIRDRNRDATIDPDPKREDVQFVKIVGLLNEATGKSFRASSKKTQSCIRARLREGFNLDDFKAVIMGRAAAWAGNSKMAEYLRPETLFGQKFESYLQAARETLPAQDPRPYDSSGPTWLEEATP